MANEGEKPTPILDEVFSRLNHSQRKTLRKEIRELTGLGRRRFPWWARLGWQTILFVLGFVGGSTFVQVRNSYPDVNPTQADPKDAFRFPFVVSNDQPLVTFYAVTPSYEILAPDVERGKGTTVWGLRIRGTLANPATLHPSDKVPFRLMDYAVAGLPPHVPDHLTVTMIVRFELHLVPLWSWHRSRQFRWDMMKDSNGTPFWIPGYIEQ